MRTRWLAGVVGMSLLLASCGQQVGKTVPVESDLPLVPVAVRPARPDCAPSATAGAARSAARLVGMEQLSGENHLRLPGLRAQTDLPDNLQSLLYTTRALVNGYYYGFSTVDLQAVHARYAAIFRQGKDKSLAFYPIDDAVDVTMSDYLDAFGDEHTFYRNLAQATSYRNGSAGNPTPTPIFGVSYAAVPDADGALILSVRGDAPFYQAGLRRGDVLTAVDGHPLTRVDTSGSDAGNRTNRDAYATIISAAAGKGEAVTISYTRAGVAHSVSVQAQVLSSTQLPYGELVAGTSHYYLRLPTFSGKGIADRVHALVTDARGKGASDIIVDLRDNGGGRLVEFVGAAGAFSPATAGEILEDNTANDTTFRYDASAGQIIGTDVCRDPQYTQPIARPDLWTGRVVILTNAYSASASELFSQALRLGGKAHIVGEKTYGVSNTFTYAFDTPGERNISVTAGRGRLLNGQYATVDVTPDEAAPDDLSALAQGHDLAMQAALAYLDR